MRPLTNAGRGCPEGACFAAASSGLDRAGQNEHKLIGRVRVNWYDCSFSQSGAVDRTVGYRLGQRHKFDAGQEIDSYPRGVLWGYESLLLTHCGSSPCARGLRATCAARTLLLPVTAVKPTTLSLIEGISSSATMAVTCLWQFNQNCCATCRCSRGRPAARRPVEDGERTGRRA